MMSKINDNKTRIAILCEEHDVGALFFSIFLFPVKAHELEVFAPVRLKDAGLQKVIELQPQIVILTDIKREHLYETIDILKQTNPTVKIIAYSAQFKEDELQHLKEMGVAAIFEKPFDGREIRDAVFALHSQRQQGN